MATIIEELIVKLGLDSKDLTSKGKAADKSLKDIEGSTKKVTTANKEVSKSFGELGRTLGSFLALIGGTYAIKSFVMDTINANAALDRFSKNIGLSVTTVSAWGNAVEELGGSSKSLQGTMDMLSKQQTQLRLTGESSLIPFFARLGINIGAFGQKVRPVDEILLDLSERFSHMDRTQANNMGRMLGLDQDTLNLLLQGRQAVELMIKRQKEHNAVTKEEAEQDAKWQRSIVQLNQSFNKFSRDLLQQAAPALDTVIGWLTRLGSWVHANREFVVDFLAVLAVGLAAIAVATLPITATTAAIVALAAGVALLYQDYQTWKNGGNSFVDWQVWKDRIDAVKEAIAHLRDELKGLQKVIDVIDKIPGVAKLNAWMNPPDEQKKDSLKKFFGVGGSHSKSDSSISDRARVQAARISQKTGIPADFIYAQFAHETGNFSNRGAKSLHNFAGVNVPGGKGQDYRDFGSDDKFGDYFANLMRTLYPDTLKAKTAGEYAHALKNGVGGRQYYSDSESNYTRGIRGASSTIAGASTGGSSSTTNDQSKSVTTGDINIFTKATDAAGIAGDINRSMNYLFTSQANSGLT